MTILTLIYKYVLKCNDVNNLNVSLKKRNSLEIDDSRSWEFWVSMCQILKLRKFDNII
jgi:hypothetical protein